MLFCVASCFFSESTCSRRFAISTMACWLMASAEGLTPDEDVPVVVFGWAAALASASLRSAEVTFRCAVVMR